MALEFGDSPAAGGLVVCYGSGRKVTFHKSTLVVIKEAQDTVSKNFMSQSRNTDEGLSLFCSGASTVVNLIDTKFTGGAQGAVVRDRACLKVTGGSFTDMSITGIESREEDSSIHLTQCTFRNAGHCNVSSWGDPETSGIAVRDNSEAIIEPLQLSTGTLGVLLCGNARMHMTNSTLCKTKESCMHVSEGSTATVKNCMFSESEMHGVLVKGDCSRVDAEACKFFRNGQGGASAFAEGQVKGLQCKTRGNQKAGLWAQMGGQLEVSSCSSFNDTVGAGAGWHGTVIVSDTSMRDCRLAGLQVCDNSTAQMKGCSVSNSAG